MFCTSHSGAQHTDETNYSKWFAQAVCVVRLSMSFVEIRMVDLGSKNRLTPEMADCSGHEQKLGIHLQVDLSYILSLSLSLLS